MSHTRCRELWQRLEFYVFVQKFGFFEHLFEVWLCSIIVRNTIHTSFCVVQCVAISATQQNSYIMYFSENCETSCENNARTDLVQANYRWLLSRLLCTCIVATKSAHRLLWTGACHRVYEVVFVLAICPYHVRRVVQQRPNSAFGLYKKINCLRLGAVWVAETH